MLPLPTDQGFLIRKLDNHLINQIAAGEVIERPAAVVKELVENALDAKADTIEVILREGGKALIQVNDNGHGMNLEDMHLALERHATSKLPTDDLFNINSFGFRGEALPSIASVARLTLLSRLHNAEKGWQLPVYGGIKQEAEPVFCHCGTRVIVKDLFYAIPARLKFLKTVTTEMSNCRDYLERLAMCNHHVSFTLKDQDRLVFNYPKTLSLEQRLQDILGKSVLENMRKVNYTKDGMTLEGFISLPTFNYGQSNHQYFFVNYRPIKDKLLSAAIKVAYHDFLENNRYPAAALFLNLEPCDVDVNVHPAKTEVRFRDSQAVRNFIISSCRQTLADHSQQTSSHLANQAVALFQKPVMAKDLQKTAAFNNYSWQKTSNVKVNSFESDNFIVEKVTPYISLQQQTIQTVIHDHLNAETTDILTELVEILPTTDDVLPTKIDLGIARLQLCTTYILSEIADGFILIDQHAAHERLVYEQLKQQSATKSPLRQALLLPIMVQINHQQFTTLLDYQEQLKLLGFGFDLYGEETIVVREVPNVLNKIDHGKFIIDFLDQAKNYEVATNNLNEKYFEILADTACRNSIRAGKKLTIDEMNELLRQMEKIPNSGQCNHGRPTYVKISKNDLDKLFHRK